LRIASFSLKFGVYENLIENNFHLSNTTIEFYLLFIWKKAFTYAPTWWSGFKLGTATGLQSLSSDLLYGVLPFLISFNGFCYAFIYI
jgi:hypothetical protein